MIFILDRFHCDSPAGLLQDVCAGSIKYNFVGVSSRRDDETAQQTTRRMNVRNLDKCKKLRFSTCLMLAGKRLSSQTEIWQRTIRQYLIAPSAGMNYSSANNGVWCTKCHTGRRNFILFLKLRRLISSSTFVTRIWNTMVTCILRGLWWFYRVFLFFY